ncbi:MAG: hypothetical protein CME62_17010 [Halobacteriovoraceae bacterium]|nr:hypothetical protein [Halobacteriovoraceae bacterium]
MISCVQQETPELTELEWAEDKSIAGIQSQNAFEQTLHPVLAGNCAGCHGDNGPQIKHASSNPGISYDVLEEKGLINFDDTANSRLVTKIKDGHQGFPASFAVTLQEEIDLWILKMNGSGGDNDNGGGAGSGGGTASASEIAFGTHLHGIFKANCSSCHGDQSAFSRHGASDRYIAFSATTGNKLVDLDNPSDSRVIDKIAFGHNCWSGNCSQDAADIKAAIEDWAEDIGKGGSGSGGGGTGGGSTFDRDASAEVFKTTVHPILRANCKSCHTPDAGSPQAPFHSQLSYKGAHDAVIDTARVDFQTISNSRLVKRLREDKHYCWSGNCNNDADTMQAAIQSWADQIDTSGVGTVNGAKTTLKGIPSAVVELPETIQGTIVMQAEDAVIEGRYKLKTDSQASNLFYVSGDSALRHPIEGTARNITLRQSCEAVEPSDLNESVNGLVRYSERRRHIDQSGYRYYSMQLRASMTRPQYRDEYFNALKSGNYTNIDRFLLRAGIPDEDYNGPAPVRLTNDNGDNGVDNRMRMNFARTLPEFTSFDQWKANVESNNANLSDFFAPKYGPNNDQFWSANESQIRNFMRSNPDYIRQLTKTVVDEYRNWFFDRRDPDGNGPQSVTNWDAENGIRSLPYDLRKLPSGEKFVVMTWNRSNYSQAINSSIKFFNEFIGKVGSDGLITYNEAKDDNYSEAYARALQNIPGTSMPRIFKYVYFEVVPDSRDFNDFDVTHRRSNDTTFTRSFDLNKGDVNLDLTALYTGGSNLDPRQISINNYATTLKPILVTNCVGCHGDGSGRPQFAQANDTNAYDEAAAVGGFINFTNPRNARAVQRMLDDRHNCGSDTTCDNLGNSMIQAINDWKSQNDADNAAAAQSNDDGIIALSDKERTPGRARYKFKVTEAGDYNVWLKMKVTDNDNNDVRVRVLDDKMRPVRSCNGNQSCYTTENFYKGKSNSEIQRIGCEEFSPGNRPAWEWYTPSIDNRDNRKKWTLDEGVYYLEVVEDEVLAAFDMVALSKNPEFNPAKNLIDEGLIQNASPKILKYDLSSLLGTSGTFEIEVKEKESGDSYIFRNPRFRGVSSNIRFRNLKILVNNQYEFSNSTYTKLNRVVEGADSGILTNSSLIALSINGPTVDSFAFVFEDLALTSQPAEALDEDAPVPVTGRECLDPDLFARTVMPVLNNFKLMLKDDYIDYAENEFPSTRGNEAGTKTVYNCTTCHNEQHPYFKMTTFFDRGQEITQENIQTLCNQAISRVDFGNFERSLLLRGLNGTFNHPKLHFIQKGNVTGSGASRGFQKSSIDPSGYATEFIGFRFEKWSSSELKPGNYTGEDREYLASFLGRYKTVAYRTYDRPFDVFDGEVIANGDSIKQDQFGENYLERSNNGRSLFDIIDPRDHLGKPMADRPQLNDGPWKIKDSCYGKDFGNSNGIITDTCNNNSNYITEFENVKQTYRESIINWMSEEKRLYDLQN